MNKAAVRNYAPLARRDFLQAVTDRAAHFGLTATKTEPITEKGDVVVIGGRPFPKAVGGQRKALEARVKRDGFAATMEALAYTWFNRLVAIRFMEIHEYLENGEGGASYRVLSHPEGKPTPEILAKAEHVELPGMKKPLVIELKLDGKETELYRLLLIAQCNALHSAMPFLFEKIEDETELVLPESLLHTDSILRKLVNSIEEEDWQEVEILGWIYESYIAEQYEAVIGKVVAGADIPAATQRFTPKWVVKYLVHNTLGRLWLSTYPTSPLKAQLRYYVEPAEQTPEVQDQLKALTPTSLNPEEITFLDPACGSAHILVEAYDLFKEIYRERGYPAKSIPRLILEKNLFGLEIDDRAAQLAAFALLMKARADDRRIFTSGVQPHVVALQETKGLNAKDITDALNEPVLEQPLPPSGKLFEDDRGLFSEKNMAVAGGIAQADVAVLIGLFEDAKNLGSLIRVPPTLAAKIPEIETRTRLVARMSDNLFTRDTAETLLPVIAQAKLLAGRYGCVVANPPYIGGKYFNAKLKAFIGKEYKDAKADLCVAFIERAFDFVKTTGHVGEITMQSWMFLSSFESFRMKLLEDRSIRCMAHLGPHAFPNIGGQVVQVTMFVASPQAMAEYRGTYHRLIEGQSHEKEQRFHTAKDYTPSNADFAMIPGSPVAYWVSEAMRRAFASSSPASAHTEMRQGLITGEDARFVRYWHEVSLSRSNLRSVGKQVALHPACKWFAFAKGGTLRRWYGNLSHVVNWEDNGREIKNFVDEDNFQRSRPQNIGYYFREGSTWSRISVALPSFRLLPAGCIFSDVAPTAFSNDGESGPLLAFLNSNLIIRFLEVLSPTTHFETGQLQTLPINRNALGTVKSPEDLITISRLDWDSFETSWDFQTLPVLQHKAPTLQQSQEAADAECLARFSRLKELEEENNRLFINAYGLQDEFSPEVPNEQITLYQPDRAEDVKRLLSYILGCAMGRYSLDKPGLIYANAGNADFDPTQYTTFPADDDGIVPLSEIDWGIADDAVNRVVEFVCTAWPKEYLEANLRFLADSLDAKKNEPARDTIRRYLATGFYKDHLRWYKRRPIYWLFSSGKERAFQALVYLHRYHEGTLARLRTDYLIPLQSKVVARIDQLDGDIAQATGTAHRRKLQKEQGELKKQRTELTAYDEKLRHAADQRITLDLDDGVKVNYAKFGDLLAEVKAVCGAKEED